MEDTTAVNVDAGISPEVLVLTYEAARSYTSEHFNFLKKFLKIFSFLNIHVNIFSDYVSIEFQFTSLPGIITTENIFLTVSNVTLNSSYTLSRCVICTRLKTFDVVEISRSFPSSIIQLLYNIFDFLS